jgi:GNAT superfamily N-acetyltransferase
MEHMIIPACASTPGNWPTLVHARPAKLFLDRDCESNEKESILMSQTIRLATLTDLPDLMTSLRALAEDLGDPFDMTEQLLVSALFGTASIGFALLAGAHGVALVQPQVSTASGGVLGYVSHLWVAQDERGSGLGSGLLAAAARESAARWDAVGLRLAVQGDTRRLRALYARLGLVLHPRDQKATLTGVPFQALQQAA